MSSNIDIRNIVETLTPDEGVVSFREFVLGEDYCNAKGIYSFWLDEMGTLTDPIELIIDGSLGGKCQRGDTYVVANNGIRQLKDLVTHKEPDTSKETTHLLFVEGKEEATSHTYYSGVKATRKFMMTDGTEFECSLHHPFKVWRCPKFEWVQAKDIKEGDLFKVDLSPLKLRPFEPTVIKWNRNYNHNLRTISTKIDVRFGYFLGLMAGDGCYTGANISFCSLDVELSSWVSKYTGRKIRVDVKRNGLQTVRMDFLKPFFKKLGVLGQNSDTKTVPQVILDAPFPVQVAFVRGLMDTDGYVDDRHVGIDLNSKELLRFVKAVLNGLGVHSWFTSERGKSYRFIIEEKVDLSFLFSLDRKRDRLRKQGKRTDYSRGKNHILLPGLREYLDDERRRLGIQFTRLDRKENNVLDYYEVSINTWKRCKTYYNLLWLGYDVDIDDSTDVIGVKSIGRGECELFDLTNPISQSYRANGVVSHNTVFN